MARLIIIVLLLLTSCAEKREAPDLSKQLTEQRQELEKTKENENFWQVTATILAGIVILALAVGAMLGSKAKEDADGQ